MSIKFSRNVFIILILLIMSASATRIKRPGWEADLIYLSMYLNMDINEAENKFYSCKKKLADCESILLFIAKSNLAKATEMSRKILKNSINKTFNIDDYFLNLRAAQVLARNGEASYLTNLLDSEDKNINDSYTLAYAKKFKYSHLILDLFLDNKSGYFCSYSNYIDPFLLNNYPNRNALIKKIFSKILGKNKSEHDCALQILGRNEQILDAKYLSVIYKKVINLFYDNNDIKINEYLSFIDRWYSRFKNNDELTKVLLEYILTNGYFKNDQNIFRIIANNSLMFNLETKRKFIIVDERHKEKGYLEKVRITNGIILLTSIEFMLLKEYKKGWSIYFKQINEVQLINLLSKLIENNEKIIDRRQKLEHIFRTDIFKKSYVSQSIVAKAMKKEFPVEVKVIIKDLFQKSNNLQKSTLIARHPKHLSPKSVIRVNANDPWIKLAEMTNLLTICEIEVPPVSSELSDPEKLTKYLEDAEVLIKDCSRIKSK